MVLKINKISAMNNAMEKLLDQTRIDEIFKTHQLNISDYKITDAKPRKDGNVTKWVNVKDNGEEYAFKNINENDKSGIQNQVTILRELHNWQNIIKFYGLTYDENKWYLVTEWAEHGNLRELYSNRKDLFDLELKLRISLDIARGLNFLRTVEILHRDVRAENVLITHDNTAKLTNFKSSRLIKADTKNQSTSLEQIRYCAPELLNRVQNFKYNNKCEVYSFGILLWEISEGKTPYEGYDDILKITELVLDKYREPFSENNQTPEEFKNLARDAVNPDPESRPKITTMFEILNSCLKSFKRSSYTTKKPKKHEIIDNNTLINAPIVIPFAEFLPSITQVGNILDNVDETAQAAEHNKRICKVLKQRVYAVNLAMLDLKVYRDDKGYFNEKNHQCLQNLVTVIIRIEEFVINISQMTTLLKLNYNQPEIIEKAFKDLCKDFDDCIASMDLPNFTAMIKNKIHPEKEVEALKTDQEELNKYFGQIVDIGDNNKDEAFKKILKINEMNNEMEKLLVKQTGDENDQSKIDKVFHPYQLEFSDYVKIDKESRKNGRVTKWVKSKVEYAFKSISDDDKSSIQNQVTILKEFHNWQNIIKFYGLIFDGNRWHLVTEWAEYGNLREFYTNHKYLLDIKLKLCISLDIARGLNFLKSVEILHRDIRAENILITHDNTAKLTNFKLSRSFDAATQNQNQSLEQIRYCAPELLKRAPNFKYNNRCEVYSFGILLWEISEGKTPYEHYDDIVEITDLVCKKNREPFSGQMPEKFKNLALDAVNHDPEFRPKITTMFEVLNDCFESFKKSSDTSLQDKKSVLSKHTTVLQDFESFNSMTLAEAVKQHKIVRHKKIIGDLKAAYKCFEAYANSNTTNRNQIKAKYYKAYYISKGYAEISENKDKIVAELFKEVADDEANEFPDAKVRYGDCLYNGKGVEKNPSEALKYFEKAAENGYKVAMYNAGKLYYNGGNGVEKNEEKAIHYMKLAIYQEYEPAIKFCKDNDISL